MTWNLITSTLGTVALAVLVAAPAPAATTPAQKCQSDKNKEVAKYSACRQKAEAKFALKGDAGARTAALQKCLVKYQTKWPALEAKAPGACPSTGDQASIQGAVDAHTTDVAGALAGGPLPDCDGDLATCSADLATCAASLPAVEASLAACATDLTATAADLVLCEADLDACQAAGGAAARPFKTGVTTCWNVAGTEVPCAGTGQDGELQLGATRVYVDNGDGTITDQRTGLMWEKHADDGGIHDRDTGYTWADAFAKVTALNADAFAGHTDWRLPNLNELRSIIDHAFRAPTISPAFNTDCAVGCTVLTCSCTSTNFHWSSTTFQNVPTAAYYVFFSTGTDGVTNKPGVVPRVRAVRTAS